MTYKYKHHWNPAGIYLLKVNNRNTRTRCEICSKLTIKIPERRQWRLSGVFIFNFEHVSCSSASIVNFEHLVVGWEGSVSYFFLTNGHSSIILLHLRFAILSIYATF